MSLRCRLGYHDYQGQASMRCQRCGVKVIALVGTRPAVTQPGDPARHRLDVQRVPVCSKVPRLKRVK